MASYWACCPCKSSVDDQEVNCEGARVWEMTVHKGQWGKLGVDIVPCDNVLRVGLIGKEGAVVEMNKVSTLDRTLKEGDYITAVNGTDGLAMKMLETAQGSDELRLRICRAS